MTERFGLTPSIHSTQDWSDCAASHEKDQDQGSGIRGRDEREAASGDSWRRSPPASRGVAADKLGYRFTVRERAAPRWSMGRTIKVGDYASIAGRHIPYRETAESRRSSRPHAFSATPLT